MTTALDHCPSIHYTLPAHCTLPPGHRDNWHETRHPNTGARLRYRRAYGTLHTQEWEPSDDPAEPDAGEWTTRHHVLPQDAPTPTVPDDLDQRIKVMVDAHEPLTAGSSLYPVGCICGTWHNPTGPGVHERHVAREMSLLVRGYYDIGRTAGMREGAAMLRDYCPIHGDQTRDHSYMDCRCDTAGEIERYAKEQQP